MVGPVVQFGIYAENTGSLHQGCIRPAFDSAVPSSVADQLFVNDCLIMEHACRPYHSTEFTGRDAMYGPRLPPYATDELPSYEEAIMQPLTYLKLGEPKKNK